MAQAVEEQKEATKSTILRWKKNLWYCHCLKTSVRHQKVRGKDVAQTWLSFSNQERKKNCRHGFK